MSGLRFPAASCARRTDNLAWEGTDPELILVYLGINDFGYCAPVKPASSIQVCDKRYFSCAYTAMLHSLKANYPNATIVCGTIMRTSVLGYDHWTFPELNQAEVSLKVYDEAIREAAADQGVLVVDLARCGETYETLDGVHPTVHGHAKLAEQWLRGLRALGISESAA